MNTQRIPLERLQVAPGNVRKTGGTPIYKLASSILAHGLLQNLVVSPAGDNFMVVAGGRRLQALQSLAKQGDLPPDFEVTCNVLGSVSAHEASLAENVAREAMHPVDEFLAFRQLVDDEKLTPVEISERFGCTERHVAQRLRLANVSPKLLAVYRDGGATLEQMQALALVEDHKAQEAAWGGKDEPAWNRRPEQLRSTLTAKDVAPTSLIGRYVSADEYVAAGGTLRTDMFSDFTTLPDGKLARKIAQAKLDAAAATYVAKGWGWAEGRIEYDYSEQAKYRRAGDGKPDPKLGVIVAIDYNGKAQAYLGLVKPGATAPKSPNKSAATKSSKSAKDGKSLNVAAHDELVGIRTAALRSLARECRWTALATLAASLASEIFEDVGEPIDTFLGVGGAGNWQREALRGAIAAADKAGTTQLNEWRKKLVAGVKRDGSILAWLFKEGEDTALQLLHVCAAASIVADVETEDTVHAVARLYEVDLAEGWKLTADWLAKQSKAYILAELENTGAVTKALAKLAVKDLAKAAIPLLQAAHWLPEPLRAPVPKVAKPAAKPAKKAAKKKAA